jgi:hypothetical protein
MPSWCRQVNWLWDYLSELCSSLCERRPEKDRSVACAIACQNCALYSVFPSGMTSHSKIAQFNWECTVSFRNIPHLVLQHKQVQILEMDRFMHGDAHGGLFHRKNYCHFCQNGQWSRILNNFFWSKSASVFTFWAWGKKLRVWVQTFPAWQTFKVTNKTTLPFFSIVSLYFSTYWYRYINLTVDGTIYLSQNFPFGAAFVCQARNFWTRPRNPSSLSCFHISCVPPIEIRDFMNSLQSISKTLHMPLDKHKIFIY